MTRQCRDSATLEGLRFALLEWYDRNKRDLPWRRTQDPYAIWVSEIMLQQTRVAAVVERYKSFMERFPTLVSLALAAEQDVLAQWSGLGYYRRARLLHKAAQFVVASLHGDLPQTAAELLELPGIGAYTAAAIASIAHGERVAVVDGNVERVLCRLRGWEASTRAGEGAIRRKVEALAGDLVDPTRPGDFNQALMELGAVVCTPRNPQCRMCPLVADCMTLGEHKSPARPRMSKKEVAYALSVRTVQHADVDYREVLLEQRPATNTVMPDLWELPSVRDEAVPEQELRMTVSHAIMQVNYSVRVCTVLEEDVAAVTEAGGQRRWVPLSEAAGMALTGLTRKVLSRARLLPAGQLEIASQAVADVL